MNRNWEKDLLKFVEFLESIELQKYADLKNIKTVEQDLPMSLLPLELYYEYYWNKTDFKDFDTIFQIYWNQKLNPYIYNFIKKYFYGCSIDFVETGFKARLYRIWMSVLTQFHFQYLWNAIFDEKLDSDANLDAMGIDAVTNLGGKKIGIQIKKVSYRREVSERKFTKKQLQAADVIVEVPYLVIDIDQLNRLIESSRRKEDSDKENKLKGILNTFNKNFHRLNNGFVIFREEYLRCIYKVIYEKIKSVPEIKKIDYSEILCICGEIQM